MLRADATVKSSDDPASQSKKGFHTAFACCWLRPWKTMAIRSVLFRPKLACSPQYALNRLSL